MLNVLEFDNQFRMEVRELFQRLQVVGKVKDRGFIVTKDEDTFAVLVNGELRLLTKEIPVNFDWNYGRHISEPLTWSGEFSFWFSKTFNTHLMSNMERWNKVTSYQNGALNFMRTYK